jgi:D-glycero-D-manno-heptose 1,7-bisphosphate phosphatase
VKCVFLDRDGTLIRHVPYLHDPRQVELLPTVVSGLRLLREHDCKLILHSNQSGVGRGYFKMSDAVACNVAMLAQIGLGPDLFIETCLSPETPAQPIIYRKPSPRFAEELMARYGVSPVELVYIGDNISDLETARNVGCAAVGLTTGVHGLRELARERGLGQFPVFDSFIEAASFVVNGALKSHDSP